MHVPVYFVSEAGRPRGHLEEVGLLDRWVKVKSQTTHTHAPGESDNPIVLLKRANEGPQPRHGVAIDRRSLNKGRGLAEGNAHELPTTGTLSLEELCRVD